MHSIILILLLLISTLASCYIQKKDWNIDQGIYQIDSAYSKDRERLVVFCDKNGYVTKVVLSYMLFQDNEFTKLIYEFGSVATSDLSQSYPGN